MMYTLDIIARVIACILFPVAALGYGMCWLADEYINEYDAPFLYNMIGAAGVTVVLVGVIGHVFLYIAMAIHGLPTEDLFR